VDKTGTAASTPLDTGTGTGTITGTGTGDDTEMKAPGEGRSTANSHGTGEGVAPPEVSNPEVSGPGGLGQALPAFETVGEAVAGALAAWAPGKGDPQNPSGSHVPHTTGNRAGKPPPGPRSARLYWSPSLPLPGHPHPGEHRAHSESGPESAPGCWTSPLWQRGI